MSGMSHQEEWMPSIVKVILPIQDGDYTDGEIQRAFWLAGLRAQIAVLEELQDADHGTDLSMCDDSAGWYSDLVSEWIESKIASLRKELGE